MSYDIDLLDPVTRKVIIFEDRHHMRGGTFEVGGSNEASLNITYNYAKFFYDHMGDEGIRSIYGKSGADSIPMLEGVIAALGDDVNEDYWEATEGNAKMALYGLLALAKMRPDGIWAGD